MGDTGPLKMQFFSTFLGEEVILDAVLFKAQLTPSLSFFRAIFVSPPPLFEGSLTGTLKKHFS